MTRQITKLQELQDIGDRVKSHLPDYQACRDQELKLNELNVDCDAIYSRLRARFHKHKTLAGVDVFNLSVYCLMYQKHCFGDTLTPLIAGQYEYNLEQDQVDIIIDYLADHDRANHTMYKFTNNELRHFVNEQANDYECILIQLDQITTQSIAVITDDYVCDYSSDQSEMNKDLTAILADHDHANGVDDDDDDQIKQDMLDNDLNEETIQRG